MQASRTVTIANGASQSGVLDLGEARRIAIIMPAAWTAAAITLLASDTAGGTFNPVHDSGGTEISITTAAARVVALTPAHMEAVAALPFVKLRSGTTGTPVNQGADRALIVLLED